MTAKHEAPPQVCDDCHQELVQEAEADPELEWNFRWCARHRVLAAVAVQDQRIVDWTLEGPISKAEALATIQDSAALAEAEAEVESEQSAPPPGAH